MNKFILLITLAMITSSQLFSQNEDQKSITTVIEKFSRAGDEQDVGALESLLNENYTVVMHQLFGSTTTSVLPREAYIGKIRNKEFGGDKRKVTIEHIEINGNTAIAKVLLKGEKMSMRSLFSLVKAQNGNWELIGDMPVII